MLTHSPSHLIALVAIIALGFFLGMRHATDADHVVAIMTIVSKQRKLGPAAWIGILWGLGHSFTILVVGVGIIVYNIVIPARIGLSMEMAVAFMLILLGVLNLTGLMRRVTERLTPAPTHWPPARADLVQGSLYASEGRFHGHVHPHTDLNLGPVDRSLKRLGFYHVIRPFLIGIVHGLAGSAAIALLVLTTIHDPYWGLGYLLLFGLGTVVGMMVITMAMAASFGYTGRRFAHLDHSMATIAGLISFGFGCFLVVQIGFVEGLFSHTPHWTPH